MQDLHEALEHLGFQTHSNPTYEAIKKRWKELCQVHHPDKPTGDEEAFKKVTHAFKMLTDAEYRHKAREQAARRGNVNARGALDIRMMIPVSFDDAFFGRKVQFGYSICRFSEDMQMIPVGDGDEVEMDRLTIDLVPNTSDGYQQLLQGRGHRCGEERGNALVVIQVLPHPRFSVRGGDVHSTENVPLDVCLRGGTIEVLTLYGMKPLKVKAGTRPGDMLKLAGCGPVRDMGIGLKTKGDQHVMVNVAYPSREELRRNKAWEKLDIDWAEDAKGDQEMADYLSRFENITYSRRV
jgi:DnaJ-class molecular chaperone